MISIWVHPQIAKLANDQTDWSYQPSSIEMPLGEIFNESFSGFAPLRFGIVDELGMIRRHINIFVGGINVKKKAGIETIVFDGDLIEIFTAVSGG